MNNSPTRTIRLATTADIPDIMPVFDEARQKMQASGNWKQWYSGSNDKQKPLTDTNACSSNRLLL